MAETKDLADVLADVRGEAAILRRRGAESIAHTMEEIADQVQRAAEDYLRFIPESEARLRGVKLAWLRRQFPVWEQDGHARKRGAVREYRALMIPRATPAAIAREAGRQGERSA